MHTNVILVYGGTEEVREMPRRPPKLLHLWPPEAAQRLRAMMYAESRSACERMRDEFLLRFKKTDPKACASLVRERLVTFFDYAQEHWIHLRTTNIVESPFGAVRLRGVPVERIVTIHNAVDADRINRLANEPLGDHLFLREQAPLIVSVGSLTKRKDIGTLIKAFAAVKAQRQAHLVIIGKGPERHEIESLISRLGLSANVHLLGFDTNPYKWMAAAAVFVSSSTAEGFRNVVAEALALGRSIIASDCPGDAAKLLGHGKWGRLVPVGDPERMADAILAALDDSNPPVAGSELQTFLQRVLRART